MKKLTVLLAAVMAFAFSANAYAANFSDISEQPVKVQDAIAKTVALGIINGYEDGTFGPEQNITRAEFSKIAVTAAGAKDTADMLANNASSFKDVKAGQWYTGWVNASESLGIFQGDGNGNFRPNDTITNQEVITVLMRLLGYNDNLTGTWPVNYVTQANKSEILDDVAVVASAAAKRSDVVVMLDATLDTELVTYDKDTNEFVLKQTTKSDSSSVTLMQDSFKGTYFEVPTFQAVDSVRDIDKQTLNWDLNYVYTDGNGATQNGSDTVIIDSETRVSYNGGSLFDLKNHQGNVYYVKEDGKLYARFIEVESYTKTVTDKPSLDGTKVKVNNTKYNGLTKLDSNKQVVTDVNWSNNVSGNNGAFDGTSGTYSKNSNYILYFNDDDQVYAVKSDKDLVGTKDGYSYYVKDVTSSTAKLSGSKGNISISLTDDVLIYTEDGFITPADLKLGDTVQYVNNDLYVMVEDAVETLSKKTTDNGTERYTIGGKSYVVPNAAVLFDTEFEDVTGSVDIDDVYGNEVTFLLNKDNSVSAMIVDEVSTGTKLYGIVVGGDNGTSGSFGTMASSKTVDIFTSEGKTVTYDLDGVSFASGTLGKLVEYKLNKDGEIKSANYTYDVDMLGTSGSTFKIENNAYLVGNSTTKTLASNVVIFEVENDEDDVDVSIVTRSSFLSNDDLTPTDVESDTTSAGQPIWTVTKYATGFTNNNGAIKAFAYTEAGSSTYKYAIADGDQFSNADYSNDEALMLEGDENVYENVNTAKTVTNHDLIIYKQSGDELDVKMVIAEKDYVKTNTLTSEVQGYTDGLMTFATNVSYYQFGTGSTDADKDPIGENVAKNQSSAVMTDDETIVYVINSSTGYYELGDLTSISKGARVYVVVVDDEGYADLVIVDEYNSYNA